MIVRRRFSSVLTTAINRALPNEIETDSAQVIAPVGIIANDRIKVEIRISFDGLKIIPEIVIKTVQKIPQTSNEIIVVPINFSVSVFFSSLKRREISLTIKGERPSEQIVKKSI